MENFQSRRRLQSREDKKGETIYTSWKRKIYSTILYLRKSWSTAGSRYWYTCTVIKAGISRLSAVEADGCQVSRLLRGLQWLHSDCLRAQHENVGGAWHVYLDMGEERRPQTAWRGSGRSMTVCWAWPACQEGQPFIFYNSSPGPSMCTWRELERAKLKQFVQT